MDNVINFPGTEIDFEQDEVGHVGPAVSVDSVLDSVKEKGLTDVIIIGTYDDRDNFYFASTSGELSKLNWDLDRAKRVIVELAFDDDTLD